MAEIRTDADKKYKEKLDTLLKELPYYCKTFINARYGSKSIRTLYGYATDLKTFLKYVAAHNPMYSGKPLSSINFDDLKEFNVRDIEEYAKDIAYYETGVETKEKNPDGSYKMKVVERHNGEDAIRRKLASLSAFYEYYLSTDELDKNPVRQYTLPPRHDKDIIVLEKDEVDMLISGLESQSIWTDKEKRLHMKTKYRDLALYTLLLSTGLRISEATGLDMSDLDFKHKEFRIRRKGGKQQNIGMNDKVFTTLSDYIEFERPLLIKDEDEPALFISLKKNRLSPRQVETMTKTINERLFPLKHITPHKFRSTFGTNFQKKNKDIYLTASALGHSDVATTKKRYARQDQEDVTNAFKDFS